MNLLDSSNIRFEGHIKIIDVNDDIVIVDKRNAINYPNFAKALTDILTNQPNLYAINTMAFGNDGVSVDALGEVTYKTPKTDGQTGGLYNETYEKIVNNTPDIDIDNNIDSIYTTGNSFSDLVITATLDYDEPSGQPDFDNSENVETDYTFNEIGLKSSEGEYLTHVIFHPVSKSQNRKIKIIYTIRIAVGS